MKPTLTSQMNNLIIAASPAIDALIASDNPENKRLAIELRDALIRVELNRMTSAFALFDGIVAAAVDGVIERTARQQ